MEDYSGPWSETNEMKENNRVNLVKRGPTYNSPNDYWERFREAEGYPDMMSVLSQGPEMEFGYNGYSSSPPRMPDCMT